MRNKATAPGLKPPIDQLGFELLLGSLGPGQGIKEGKGKNNPYEHEHRRAVSAEEHLAGLETRDQGALFDDDVGLLLMISKRWL